MSLSPNINTKKVELLSPAGTYDCFLAAVNAGCDAVYLAGSKFGARAYAGNFSDEELIRAIKYAHLFGVKVYLTVNTLVKEKEIDELVPFVSPFYEAGLDGVILQDLGAAMVLRDNFPGINLSASTQMTVTGPAGAALLKNFGFSRIIPAREASLEDIKALCGASPSLEIEVFIHGAMCYCYSGQCLFSSMLGERSANRGRCAGPCRLEYRETSSSKKKYLLSLKDMVTIDYIPDLIKAGVKSFKIEGRMKPPEYVAVITSVYRKYIDKYLNDPDAPYEIEKKDRELLSKVYVRTNPGPGYLFTKNGPDMVSLDSPAYTPSDEALLLDIRKKYLEKNRLLPLSMYADFSPEKPAHLTLICNDTTVSVEGQIVSRAQKAPLTEDAIKKALSKLGNTPLSLDSIEVSAKEDIFLPISSLNELRRKGIEALYEALYSR